MNWEDQWQLNKRAVIREAECIGCTKCIQACPVDAILGSAKQMHTVISDECTGCELCIAPCPVDCIDMKNVPLTDKTEARQDQFRLRQVAHQKRLQEEKIKQPKQLTEIIDTSLMAKQSYIKAAIERTKNKK